MRPAELLTSELWWQGPQFLQQPIETRALFRPELSSEENEIVRSEFRPMFVSTVNVRNLIWMEKDGIPLIEHYETLGKVIYK